jgi:hypothetical protein
MVKWPLEKRSDGSRVVVKVNRRSVQWCTLKTRSSRKALMVDQGLVEQSKNPLQGSARQLGENTVAQQNRMRYIDFNVVNATFWCCECYTE